MESCYDYQPTNFLDQPLTPCPFDRMHESSSTSSVLMPLTICTGCSMPIDEQYLLCVMDTCWHERCLVCVECQEPMISTCYHKEGKIYCKRDYFELFGMRCSRCKASLRPDEIIMKASDQVFHLHCFRCSLCDDHLHKGDPYMLRDGLLLCRTDFQQQQHQAIAQQQQPTLRCNRSDEEDSFEDDCCSSDTATALHSHAHAHARNGRGPKRPRTILTSIQRRKFKQAFDVSSKPCRKVRESLASETGLSVRVVQVWFQNERAKMKKLQRRQQQNASGDVNEKKTKKKSVADPSMPLNHHHHHHRINDEEGENMDDTHCSTDESLSHSISNGFGSSNDENNKHDLADGRHLHLIGNSCYTSHENNTDGDSGISTNGEPLNRSQNPIDKLYSMSQNPYFCSAC